MAVLASALRFVTVPLGLLWGAFKGVTRLVVALLLLAAAGVAGGYLWLQTDPGQAWLGRKAGETLTGSLSGQFTIARAAISLREGITLRGVLVTEDSGAEVLTFDRFRFDFAWAPLLRRTVEITEIALDRPHVHLTQERISEDVTTFNVARVFKPRDPSPEEPKPDDGKPFEMPVDVVVRSLRVAGLTARTRLLDVDPRFAALDTDSITLDADADLRRDRSLRYRTLLSGAKSGDMQARGTLDLAEGLAGLARARGDVRVAKLEPAKMAGAQLGEAFQAEISTFAAYDWTPDAALPRADVRGLSIRTVAGVIEGRGTIAPDGSIEAKVGSSKVALAKIPWGLVRRGLDVRGTLDIDANVTGTIKAPRGRATVSACDVRVTEPSLPETLRGRSSCLKAEAWLDPAGTSLDVQGHAMAVPLHARGRVSGDVLASKNPSVLPLEATLEVGRLPVAVVGQLGQIPQLAAMPGTVELAARVRGTAANPRVYWNLDAHRVSYERFSNVDLFMSGSIIDIGTHVELIARQDGSKVAEVRLRVLPDASRPASHVLPGLPFSKEEALAALVEADVDVDGLRLPAGTARHTVEGYALLRYHERGMSAVSSLSLKDGETSFGVANLSAAADVGPAIDNPAAWKDILATVAFEADVPDLRPLTGLVPALESIDGSLGARLAMQGKLRKPLLGGRLVMEDVDIVPRSGPSIEDLAVDITGTEDRIDIRNVSLDRGGIVRASGTINGLFPFEPRFVLQAGTNDLRVMPLTAGTPTLDARVRVEGELKGGVLNATTRIPEIRLYVPNLQGARGRSAQSLEPHPDVVVYRDGKPVNKAVNAEARKEPEPGAPSELLREAHVRVLMPKDAWVQGPDVQLELQTDMRIDWVDNEVTLQGVAGLNRPGFVQVLGKRFNINTAQVDFEEDLPTDGEITVEATHVADDVTVFVEVDGPVSEPEVALRAEPELSQFEIASLLVTGKTAETRAAQVEEETGEGTGTGDRVASAAANAVGSMLAQQLLGVFARNTELVVSVDVEDTREGQAKVGVGRYVTDKLFVSFDKRFGNEGEEASNANEVRFDYRLTRQWSVEGNYGDGREGGVDLLWKRRF